MIRRNIKTRDQIGIYLFIGIMVLVAAFPLFWLVSTSLKPFEEIYRFPPNLLPSQPSIRNYSQLLAPGGPGFPRLIFNSLVISTAATAITLVLAAMAGYGLSRGRFPGRRLLLRGTLLAYLFPPVLIVVPLFVILANLGLAGTYPGGIAAYVVMIFPFATWLATAYFASIPRQLEEAAIIDGASNFRAFLSIVLPLTKPGLAAIAIFSFINVWNEFLYALVIIGGGPNQTIAVGLNALISSDEGTKYGLVAAGAIIATIPILLIFTFAQRHIVSGLAAGAVKE